MCQSMRFRESPPNSRLTTLCCTLHPAICISHKVLAQVQVWESIDVARASSLVLLHQYPLPACFFVFVDSLLAATLCQSSSSLGPRPPTSGQSTILRSKPSFWAPTKVCGLRSCSVCATAFQYSNDNVIRHATTKGSTAAALRPGPGPLCAWAMTPPRGATTE